MVPREYVVFDTLYMMEPAKDLQFFDSHTHLDFEEFEEERAEIIQRAKSAGVSRMVTIGAGRGVLESARAAVEIASQTEGVWASVGVHPLGVARLAASGLDEREVLRELSELAIHPKVVAIGECGIDLYRDATNQSDQERVFRAQIALARRLGKPLIIHSRNAGERCLEILDEEGAASVGGVFHCFSETSEFSRRLTRLSFLVSFPGIVTFKNAKSVRAAVAEIPLEQMLIETDAPYLAPEPFRGQRCESAMVVRTAAAIAELKGVPLGQVAATTTSNACKLFRVP